jgi:hypothetical protein
MIPSFVPTDGAEPLPSLCDLPDEILDQVFGLSGIIGITSVSCVCKRFARIVDAPSVWRTVSAVERLYPLETTKTAVINRYLHIWPIHSHHVFFFQIFAERMTFCFPPDFARH